MAAACWLGIDPGTKKTGLCLRLGSECLGWLTIERRTDETEIGVGTLYWDQIEEAIDQLTSSCIKAGHGIPCKAIEGVRPVSAYVDGKRRDARPLDLMALAATFGAILARNPGAVIIPPDKNGRGMLASYPAQLITPAERRKGLMRVAGDSSIVSHARSAFDVAGTAARAKRAAA